MKYVEAFSLEHTSHYTPQPDELSLFLGGGITGCPDWQAEICEGLRDTRLTLLNPRRANWPINDVAASTKQIEWEFEHLQKAHAIMFWFPAETLCPITLFEYGKWIVRNKPVFAGCHPDYARKLDLEVQTKLERPLSPKIKTSLKDMIVGIKIFAHMNRFAD